MTRRMLRQQAGFGCASCGCPVIEYHHIIPYGKTQTHDPDHMIALCPTCHKKADSGGPWSTEFVYNMKENPHNKDLTKEKFAISSSNFAIKCGIMEFEGSGDLIKLQKKPVLSINRASDGIIHLSSFFYDNYGRSIAFISDNEWGIYINRVWDIEYIAARSLIVRSAPRNIVLEMEVTDQAINIKRCLFLYRGSYLKSEMLESGSSVLDIRSSDGKTHLYDKKAKKIIFNPGASITVN
jgi:trigger factor